MLFRTHAIFSILIALIFFNNTFGLNKYLFMLLVFLGSTIPDIDKSTSKINHKLKITKPIAFITRHRGIFHSMFFALLLPGLIFYFINKPAGLALFIGYLSHLVIDGLNIAGINFLHPFKKLHLSGFIETGSVTEHLLTIILLILTILRFKALFF